MAVLDTRPISAGALNRVATTQGQEGKDGEMDDNEEWMITTTDNPFDPFEDFKPWMVWDMAHDYNTVGLLARLTFTSEELSDADQSEAMRHTMREIVKFDTRDVYTIVTRQKPTG